jgi:uncharacterized protein
MKRRWVRLSLFALLALSAIYLALSGLMAWSYVTALAHPGCISEPALLEENHVPQELTLQSADGVELRAWYYPPQNGVVVIAMGGPSGSLGRTLPPVGYLLKQGYGAIQVDGRNCATPPADVTIGAKEVLDAEAALAYLQTRPEVRHIAIAGFSMGGVTAIRTAARRPAIEAVIAEGGYYNMGKDFVEADQEKPWPERFFLYTVVAAFWLKHGVNPFAISPVDDLPEISPRPVLLIYGENEMGVGRAEIQFAAARSPKKLWVVPGGNHGTNYAVAPQEYERQVAEFLKEAIPTDARRQSIPAPARLLPSETRAAGASGY